MALTELPAGYVKADYVESIGNVCAQTYYKPHCKDRMELKYYLMNTGSMGVICARAPSSTTTRNFTALVINGHFRFDYNNVGTSVASPVVTAGTNQVLVLDGLNRRVTLDGETIYNLPGDDTDDWTCAGCMSLFAWRGDAGADYGGFARMRVYSFRVVDKDGLERVKLQPCINASTLRPGLYDLVSNCFYDNGNTVNTQLAFDVDRAGYKGLLPSGYQSVDNIEADGAQYLMTTNFVHCMDRLELRMCFKSSGSGNQSAMFCARGSTESSKPFFSGLVIGGKYRFDYVTAGNDTQKNANPAFVANSSILFVMDGKNKSVQVNATSACELGPNSKFANYDADYGDDWTTFGTLAFFAWHNAGTALGGCANAEFYSSRLIGQDGTIKLQLVPCFDKQTGLAGAYDLAGERFYSSAGSRPFKCERKGLVVIFQ